MDTIINRIVEYTSEDRLQADCYAWAVKRHPQVFRLLWAVPNGGERNPVVAAKLQATGVLSGVHDIHLLWCGFFYTFELKVRGRKLTRDRVVRGRAVFGQYEWAEAVSRHGGRSFKIESLDSFKHVFTAIIEGRTADFEPHLLKFY